MDCDYHTKLRDDLYLQELNVINGVKLTFREIDLISCIISGRTAKGAASLLYISPKTAENHIYSAMLKTKVSSRDTLISFIEKSQKLHLIQKYYRILVVQCAFENSLRHLEKLKTEIPGHSLSLKCSDPDLKERLISHLEKHLQLANIKVIHPDVKTSSENRYPENKDDEEYTLHFSEEKGPPKYLDLSYCKNYYAAVLTTLEEFFSKENIQKAFREFDQVYGISLYNHTDQLSQSPSKKEIHEISGESDQIYCPKRRLYSSIKLCPAMALVTSFFIISYHAMDSFGMWRNDQIRSEFIIPEDKKLLSRPELFAQLNDALAGKDIRSVVLVGIGGAGKTTLARQYARQQKDKVIWEIHAETQESLKASFEKLAQKLALTEDDQKALRDIQNIMAIDVREERILEFVKEGLKLNSNWFLVYDNMENFTDVGNYFPQDPKTWGQGKILITSRNVNIQNNSQIAHVISIGELNHKQKGDLFRKIMTSGSDHPLSSAEQEEESVFLEKIPPFPLDISVAAYYIKTTNISTDSFLERLNKQDNEFASIQESLLKEAGTYLKTRYCIITLSIEEMIKSHKDFEDLLLFISLLDSQNIPRDLLNKYKNEAVADNFIYHLKKHSLISNKVHSTSAELTFSIHRSTQAIVLTYLRKKRDLDHNKHSIETIASVLETSINDCIENFDYPQMEVLKCHCEVFFHHDTLLTNSITGSIGLSLAGIYCYQIFPKKTQSILKKVQGILNKNPSENQAKIALVLRILGQTYLDLGQPEIAKAYLDQSCELYERNPYKDQMAFARTLGHLAWVEGTLGNYEKSKNMCEQALDIYEHQQNNPLKVAWALSFLGWAHLRLGDYEKALEALNRSYDIYNEFGPHCHQGHHRVILALGIIHRELGDYNKAKSFLQKSIEVAESYSKTFFGLWCSRIHLGAIYGEMGDYKNAKDLIYPGLVLFEQFYGENNILTARTIHELGRIYLRENNIEKAESYFKRSLAICQKMDHVEIYFVLESFADLCLKKSVLSHQKDTKQTEQFKNQALDYLKQALEVVKDRFPEDSPHKERIELKIKGLEEN